MTTENKNINKTFDAVIFNNGRVIIYDDQDFEDAIHNGKELALICLGWAGGYARVRGANETPNYYVSEDDPDFGKPCYDCYSYEIKDQEFTTEQLQRFYKMIFSDGVRIIMDTGHEATAYQGDKFIDWDTKKSDYLYSGDISDEDFEKKRSIINVEMTVRHMRETDKDMWMAKVQALINYRILPEYAINYVK